MTETKWTITCRVFRQKQGQASYYEDFKLEVNPDEYVLDAVERIWAFHDRSLCYRHACHHSTCGACGMRVNGVEKLTCITLIRDVTSDGGVMRIDPLRNFPVTADLAVDMGVMYANLDRVGAPGVLPVTDAEIERPHREWPAEEAVYIRLSDCLECGMCISACPISLTTGSYFGPAVLAGAHMHGLDGEPQLINLVDSDQGVWRCHSAFECTAVCPSFVDPARRIMELRKQVVVQRVRRFFGGDKVNTNIAQEAK